MKCPRCEQENPPQAKFCLECGIPFRQGDESDRPDSSYWDLQRALSEALEQQTATAEILGIISGSPADAQPVFDAIAVNALRLCDARGAVVVRYDGELLHVVAHHNVNPEAVDRLRRQYPVAPDRRLPMGRAVLDGAVVQVADLQTAVEFSGTVARQFGARGHVAIPLLHRGRAIGAIGISRPTLGPFSGRQIALLQTFAAQAVIAIENARLFTETKEALEQQTATSEILGVISSSPTDVQPVFAAVLANAARLCDASDATMFRVEGEELHLVAHDGPIPAHGPGRFPLVRGTPPGRIILDRRTVHIADLQAEADEFPEGSAFARLLGFRTILGVPLLRGGEAIGAITVRRTDRRLFADRQVQLLELFADQAVIAIENVRLFNETKEALERQTATSEILRVISSSPTDTQPVFDIIAANAARLCAARDAQVLRVEGGVLRLVSAHGSPSMPPVRALSRGHAVGRAVIDRQTIHVRDRAQAVAEFPQTSAPQHGVESFLAVPLLREDVAVGVIRISRTQLQPFTEQQIALVQTFADQAVIAIENVRLFTELQEKHRALTQAHAQVTEALEQQTATSEILRVIASSPTDLDPVLEAVARNAAQLCRAEDVAIIRAEEDGLTILYSLGPDATLRGRKLPHLRTITTRAVREVRTVHVPDLLADPDVELRPDFRRFGWRTGLAVPLVREGVALGTITARRSEVRPFSDQQIKLLETFADQAVIAIENVRLFTELQEKNRALTQAHGQVTEALEQQTATSEILRVISGIHTDTQPVFDTIVQSAVRLCKAATAAVFLTDGRMLYEPANYGSSSEVLAVSRARYPRPLDMDTTGGIAVLTKSVVHVPDTEDPLAIEWIRQSGRLVGFRSVVTVPMLREGDAVGAILVTRRQPGPFSDTEVKFLKTFADQAVIAIENVRLFKELEARTAALTRSVEQLTALGEVGRAVSSTLDLETVLTTIVSRAVQLSGLDGGVVLEYEEGVEEFVQRAQAETGGALAAARRATRIRKGEGVVGRTANTLEPVQVPDITVPGAYVGPNRENLIESGIRAIVAVPMVREGRLIGCLGVTRNRPGAFPAETIELLRTFATQSALAIQNARLFHEIEDKSRQLEAASRHKSEFLANMSHELRTPLNAIIGFSEVLGERMFGELNAKQDEYVKDVHASGQHLLSLINDILDLSKIEAGRMELELSEFNLPATLENALTLVRERAGRHGIALHTTVDERLGQVRADERKIRQVVLNLLSNAIKFTPDGGRIDVRAVPGDGGVEVSVSDTGVGIASEDQEAIFEEFRQVGTAAKKVEGTGLGLALSRKFIELHGGRIWVQSQVGLGSTFTFTVPVPA